MNKDKNKNLFGQHVSVKTHLAVKSVVIFFLVFALYFSLENHFQNPDPSTLTLLIVVLLGVALTIEIGNFIYSLWKNLQNKKNT